MEFADSCARLAEIASDYRKGSAFEITAKRVIGWADQFPAAVRHALVDELCHVLKRTYASEELIRRFLEGLVTAKTVVGDDPRKFWLKTRILGIQRAGGSQKELLSKLRVALAARLGGDLTPAAEGSERFLFLDDALFSGKRASSDLHFWIRDHAPAAARVICIFLMAHQYGVYSLQRSVERSAKAAGKRIELGIFWAKILEDRHAKTNFKDVLHPSSVPPNAVAKHKFFDPSVNFSFKPRQVVGYSSPYYSSELRRCLLEDQLLLAGLRIVEGCRSPSEKMRPLGFGEFGVGFGGIFVSHRNCPNNAPLALWWGGGGQYGAPWYPLFARVGYAE